MRSLKKITLVAVSCLFMSGCASFVEDFDSFFVDDGPRETVYYDADVAMTYPEMAREMSNGSVQIYSLDGPVAPLAPSASLYQDGGVASSVDQNVTVYPFGDGSFVAPRLQQPQPQASSQGISLVPPSEERRPLASPFGGAIQTPVSFEPTAYAVPTYAPVSAYVPAPVVDGSSRVYYSHGSSALDNTDRQVLDFVAGKGGRISVEGHASDRAEVKNPVERSIVNLKMSMDRAFNVSSALIRSGVPAHAIETKAYGATKPSAPIDGVGQEAASRRVEIYTDLLNSPQSFAPVLPLARY